MKGDNRRQRETRRLESPERLPHHPTPIPHEGRQPETTGDKTTSEAKKATTRTNTHAHMKGDNRRQSETSPLQRPKRLPHRPTPTPTQRETTGDNGRQDDLRAQKGYHTNQRPSLHEGRQPETTGDKTTSEAKKATATGDKTTSEARKATTRTNTHPHIKGDNRTQRKTRRLQRPRRLPHEPTPIPT